MTQLSLIPDDHNTNVLTHNTSYPNGWLVWLRRVDKTVSFSRTWEEYVKGFGHPEGNLWLGLEKLHKITHTGGGWMLKVELESWKGEQAWAEYSNFSVSDISDNYTLTIAGYDLSSTAEDRLENNNNQSFSTIDNDNDGDPDVSCVTRGGGGGWWYRGKGCSTTFPTAKIGNAGNTYHPYMFWSGAFPRDEWSQALKSISMSIKQKRGAPRTVSK